PIDACAWFYECQGCKTILKPKAGDCCVYCSYGTTACPPVQKAGSCCVRGFAQANSVPPGSSAQVLPEGCRTPTGPLAHKARNAQLLEQPSKTSSCALGT